MKECDWMAKERIYEVAKELDIDNKVVIQKAKELGFDVKNHMSSLEDAQVKQLKGSFQNSAPANKAEKTNKKSSKIKISVSSIRKNEKRRKISALIIVRIINVSVITTVAAKILACKIISSKNQQLKIC